MSNYGYPYDVGGSSGGCDLALCRRDLGGSKGEGVEYKSYLAVSTFWEKIVSWPITGV